MSDLKTEIQNYHTARARLIRRATEIQVTLERVRKVLGPKVWASIPESAMLPPAVRLKPQAKQRGRPVSDKHQKLVALLKAGPKTKRELARLMNTTLVDLDRVIYGKAFTRQGKLFRVKKSK